jgi:hypothetical protein
MVIPRSVVDLPQHELALAVEEPALGVLESQVLPVGPEVAALGILESYIVAILVVVVLHSSHRMIVSLVIISNMPS